MPPAADEAIGLIQTINRKGWAGDVGIGALAALLVGFPTWLFGPGGALLGVPMSVVWAGTAFVGGFFCSLALYTVPDEG